MKIWGYWTTLGWSVVALLAGQCAGFGTMFGLCHGSCDLLLAAAADGVAVTTFIVVANPVTVGVLALTVRLLRSDQREYFALKWPARRDLALGIVCLVVL